MGSGIALQVTAAAEFVFAAGDKADSFGVGKVLFGEDAAVEGFGCVGVEDGDSALDDDGAMIKLLIDKVDGAAGDFDAVSEGLLLSFEAGECGKQRGMNVEDAIAEGGDEVGREEAHVAGQADEIDVVGLETGDHVDVMLRAGATFGDADGGGKAETLRGFEGGSFGDVRDDHGDFDAGQASGADGIGDGEEVGAAAREEDAEA